MKVDKFIFLVDLIILDVEEGRKISVILGSLFLTIGMAKHAALKGELTMGIHDKKVTFNVLK